jgi:hypothetical protein
MWYPEDKHRHLTAIERIAVALESIAQSVSFNDIAGAIVQGTILLTEIESDLKIIAVNTNPIPVIGPAIAEKILIGGELEMKKGKMLAKLRQAGGPTPITDGSSGQKIAVVGIDAAGASGAQLAPGDTIAVSVGNGTNGVAAAFTADASPAAVSYVDSNGVQRTNVPSLVTGVLLAASPVDPNDPFTVSYAITKADGSAGNTGQASCQIVPGTEASEILVFPA